MSALEPAPFALFPDPRQLRNRWLADLSQAVDRQLRSPAFLEWMRCTVTVMREAASLQTTMLFGFARAWEHGLGLLPPAPAESPRPGARPGH